MIPEWAATLLVWTQCFQYSTNVTSTMPVWVAAFQVGSQYGPNTPSVGPVLSV